MRTNIFRTLCAITLAGSMLAGCRVTMAGSGTDEPPPPVPTADPAEPAEPAPAPRKRITGIKKLTVKVEGNEVKTGPIFFDTGTDHIQEVSVPGLAAIQEYMAANPKISTLRVEGHTDSEGEDAANMELSKKRGVAVVRWLTNEGEKKVNCKRLLATGFGETRLLKPETGDAAAIAEAQATNRRVQFVIAATDGKPVGGQPVDGGGQQQAGFDACKAN